MIESIVPIYGNSSCVTQERNPSLGKRPASRRKDVSPWESLLRDARRIPNPGKVPCVTQEGSPTLGKASCGAQGVSTGDVLLCCVCPVGCYAGRDVSISLKVLRRACVGRGMLRQILKDTAAHSAVPFLQSYEYTQKDLRGNLGNVRSATVGLILF